MMETDALIARLAEEARASTARAPGGVDALRVRLAAAVLGGAALAAALTALALGWRPDLAAALALPVVWYKFTLPLGLGAAATALAWRLAQPGLPALAPAAAAPAGLAFVGGALLLAVAPAAERDPFGAGSPAACLLSILLLSLPALGFALWALRRGAATRPALAGAAAGLAAGAAGTFGYALYCPVDAIGFVCGWYGLAMAVVAALGALAGRRALAW